MLLVKVSNILYVEVLLANFYYIPQGPRALLFSSIPTYWLLLRTVLTGLRKRASSIWKSTTYTRWWINVNYNSIMYIRWKIKVELRMIWVIWYKRVRGRGELPVDQASYQDETHRHTQDDQATSSFGKTYDWHRWMTWVPFRSDRNRYCNALTQERVFKWSITFFCWETSLKHWNLGPASLSSPSWWVEWLSPGSLWLFFSFTIHDTWILGSMLLALPQKRGFTPRSDRLLIYAKSISTKLMQMASRNLFCWTSEEELQF